MDFQQSDFGSGNDGFYNTNYEQQSYGYDNSQQPQPYGGYDQNAYNQPYAPAPQPQVFSPNFSEPKANTNNTGGGYTNFDDEPPLLEGKHLKTSCFPISEFYQTQKYLL